MKILSITYTLNIGSEGYSVYNLLNELAKVTGREMLIITNSVATGTDISNFQFIKELKLNTSRLYWQAWFKISAFLLSTIYVTRYHIELIQQVHSNPFLPFFSPFRRVPFVWLLALKDNPSFVTNDMKFDDDSLLVFGELPNKLRKKVIPKRYLSRISTFFKRKIIAPLLDYSRKTIEFFTIRNISLIVSGTPYTFEFYKELVSESRVVQLSEVIDLSKFKYSRPPFNNSLLVSAALFSHEGVDIAIRAMKEISTAIPEAILDVLGDGPQMNNLKKLTEELGLTNNVRFHGYVKREEVPLFLEQSRVVLLPAYIKGSGMAIKEAMAVGRPVVATRAEGHLYSIEDGYNGFIVDFGDYKAMAKASIKLLFDYDLCLQMSINAHSKATKMYNASSSAQKLAGLYSNILNKSLLQTEHLNYFLRS